MSTYRRAFGTCCSVHHSMIYHPDCCAAAADARADLVRSAAYVLYVAQREVDSIPYTAPEALTDRLRQVVPVGQELLDEIRRLREAGT